MVQSKPDLAVSPTSSLAASLRWTFPAMALTALLGFLLLVLAGRSLGPSEFSVFSAAWGIIFFFGALFSALELEGSRLAAGLGGTFRPSSWLSLRQVAWLVTTTSLLFIALASPILVPRALHGNWMSLFLVAVAVGGMPIQVSLRGTIVGAERVPLYSVLLVAEGVFRVLPVPLLLLSHSTSVNSWLFAVALGSWVWPFALFGLRHWKIQVSSEPRVPTGLVLRKALALMLGLVGLALMLTAYPTLISLTASFEEHAVAGVLAAALMLSRLPLLAFQPVQPLLIPHFVNQQGQLRVSRNIASISALTGGVLLLGSYLLGPGAIALIFGPDYQVSGLGFSSMVASSLVLVLSSLLSMVLVSRSRHMLSTCSWLAGAAVTVSILIWSTLQLADKGPLALLLGTSCTLLMMFWMTRKTTPVPMGGSS